MSVTESLPLHHLSWRDFDDLAGGGGGGRVVRELRNVERSRRLTLLRLFDDLVAATPTESFGPLPSPVAALLLLIRVQEHAPDKFDLVLDHPYTGSWVGHTIRLLQQPDTAAEAVWPHLGHLHALAAAAAVHARLDFEAAVPMWQGNVVLPTIGAARFETASSYLTATVRARDGVVDICHGAASVRVPSDPSADAPGWWGMRHLTVCADDRTLSVRLDDLDPYRGLYGPLPPDRIDADNAVEWHALLTDAWKLVDRLMPDTADAIAAGLDSIVPRPTIPFRLPSASTGEAFGSAIISKPDDPVSLGATLVHEFQHIRLGGLLHMATLRAEDPRQRFYTPWRDDPRPLPGVLQGLYAFFGVAEYWRAVAVNGPDRARRRARFEFALWRDATWRTLRTLQNDKEMTSEGQRFLDGVAERLGPWQSEPVSADALTLAADVAADHLAGWRLRHMPADPDDTAAVATSWPARQHVSVKIRMLEDIAPTRASDGVWTLARTDLTRLALAAEPGQALLAERWTTVPGATAADLAYVQGRSADAVQGYRAELVEDPDSATAWIGLGLALRRQGDNPAARALLGCPELVRAVHRKLRDEPAGAPDPESLAEWIDSLTH